jgi:hypothetical protein
MDSSVSPKDENWFLRVCHHISNAVYSLHWLHSAEIQHGTQTGRHILRVVTGIRSNEWVNMFITVKDKLRNKAQGPDLWMKRDWRRRNRCSHTVRSDSLHEFLCQVPNFKHTLAVLVVGTALCLSIILKWNKIYTSSNTTISYFINLKNGYEFRPMQVIIRPKYL